MVFKIDQIVHENGRYAVIAAAAGFKVKRTDGHEIFYRHGLVPSSKKHAVRVCNKYAKYEEANT